MCMVLHKPHRLDLDFYSFLRWDFIGNPASINITIIIIIKILKLPKDPFTYFLGKKNFLSRVFLENSKKLRAW